MAIMSLRDRIVSTVGRVPIDGGAQTELVWSMHDGSYDARAPSPIGFLDGSGRVSDTRKLYVALRDDVRAEGEFLSVFTDGIYEALQNVYKMMQDPKLNGSAADHVLVYGSQILDKGAGKKAYRFDIVDDGAGLTGESVEKIINKYLMLKAYKSDPVGNRRLWPKIVDVEDTQKSGGIGLPMAIYCVKDMLGGRFVLGNANPDYWANEVDVPCSLDGALVHMTVPVLSIREIDTLAAGERPTVSLRKPHDTDKIVREVLGTVYSDF